MDKTDQLDDRASQATEPPQDRPWQFSLAVLLIVMTLVAVVAAAFARNELAGCWVYLGCFSMFMIAWRTRAGWSLSGSNPAAMVGISIAIGLAAATAFVGTCTVPTAAYGLYELQYTNYINPGPATVITRWCVLGFATLLGTGAALLIYRLTWPRKLTNIKPSEGRTIP